MGKHKSTPRVWCRHKDLLCHLQPPGHVEEPQVPAGHRDGRRRRARHLELEVRAGRVEGQGRRVHAVVAPLRHRCGVGHALPAREWSGQHASGLCLNPCLDACQSSRAEGELGQVLSVGVDAKHALDLRSACNRHSAHFAAECTGFSPAAPKGQGHPCHMSKRCSCQDHQAQDGGQPEERLAAPLQGVPRHSGAGNGHRQRTPGRVGRRAAGPKPRRCQYPHRRASRSAGIRQRSCAHAWQTWLHLLLHTLGVDHMTASIPRTWRIGRPVLANCRLPGGV
mmetsp:Transcript_12155/g.34469  ORF Transcript_12155/g.34469 Transcript_12155/m.34469 type:complete len:280 (-) Transcript_12155:225-1064(-)